MLTRQILAFSRRQELRPEGHLDSTRSPPRCDPLLDRTLGEDVDLTFEFDPELGRCEVDPNQLVSVLMNLAVNARDAMPRGGKLTVATSNVELDEEYCLQHAGLPAGRLRDAGGVRHRCRHGRGDAGPHLRAVLHHQGARQGHRARSVDGPRHGQTERRPHLRLQRARLGHYLQDIPASIGEGTPAGDFGARCRAVGLRRSETILVVEDEEMLRHVIQHVLEAEGYRVLLAGRGEEALALLGGDHLVQLLLTDLVLPGEIQGAAVVRRALDLKPGLAVLCMSGYSRSYASGAAMVDPAVSYLEKPFTGAGLMAKVRQVLDGH